MKKIFYLLSFTLLSNTINSATAQCTYVCNNTYNFNGYIDRGQKDDINKLNNNIKPTCFESVDGIITNNLNWMNWNWNILSFNGKLDVKQTINMNRLKKVYTNGDIKLTQLSMSGNDTLFNIGELNISKITGANNGGNTIVTDRPITINNKIYNIGDTLIINNIITDRNYLDNTIKIISCGNGTPLPIYLEYFKIYDNVLKWKGNDIFKVIVQGSIDGIYYEDIETYYSEKNEHTINTQHKLFRLLIHGVDFDKLYSNIIHYNYKVNNRNIKANIDINGRYIDNIENYQGLYITLFDDGTSEKRFK